MQRYLCMFLAVIVLCGTVRAFIHGEKVLQVETDALIINVVVTDTTTVAAVKAHVARFIQASKSGAPVLQLDACILEDTKTCGDYGLTHNAVLSYVSR